MKKTQEKSITVSIRMPATLSNWLDKKAADNRRSKSAEIILYLLAAKENEAK